MQRLGGGDAAARRRRLRALARRAREGADARCGPRSPKAASSSACSDAAAIATPASGRRWAASPATLADRVDRHQRQSAQRGSRRRSRARSSRGIRDDRQSRAGASSSTAATAIRAAIAGARRGDVVLIAGKGHEDYQEANGVRTPFSDAEAAAAALAALERRMMDTATAARAVDGRAVGGNVRFARVATDTRTLAPGDLFVALKGERFDGHDFVAAAFERGAVAALVAADRADALAGQPDRGAGSAARRCGTLAAHWRARFAHPGHRRRRQQRQDDGQGNAGVDPARALRRRARARDRRQPQQRDRPAADAAAPARRASRPR